MKKNLIIISAVVTSLILNCNFQAQAQYSPPTAGLVSWWHADGNALDAMHHNDGTIVSGLAFSGGIAGSAFSLNGNGGSVLVPASSSLNVGAGNGFTVGAWIKTSDLAIGRPIVEWVVPGGFGVLVYTWTDGSVYANIGNSSGGLHLLQSASGLLVANQFQNVALSYDRLSGQGSLFLNGNVIAQANFGSFAAKTDTDMSIGYRPIVSPDSPISFLGQIDEVTLYDHALWGSEMLALATVPEPTVGALLLVAGLGWVAARRKS